MEQTETLEAWMLGLCRFAPSSCLAINRCWRTAALKFVSEIKLFAATLDLALRAISQRPQLQRLDASKCKSLHSDDALKQLSAVLRGMGPKVRPFLRPGEGLQHLYLGKATGLTQTSCQCLQRLGLQWWAFHSPPSRGSLLVSRPLFPSAGQPELIRSVVLVLQHDSRGSKGMLLNKPSKLEVELDLGWDAMQVPVCFGGSFGRSLLMLHASEELGGEEVAKGIFLSHEEVDMTRARDLLRWKRLQPDQLCCCFGYCHWQPGELEDAIRRGYFASAFCDPAFLKPPLSTELWHDLSALLL